MKTTMTMVGALLLSVSVNAQDGDFVGGDDVFNSDQIDIDGSFARKESAADRLEKMRRKLEQQNEQMVQKKIEDIRVKQEQELAGKLKNAFSGNIEGVDAIDEVQTFQAAPQKVVAAPEPVQPEAPKNKIYPYFGVKQYAGDNIDLESDVNVGLNFENQVSERFSIGFGFNYSKMEINNWNYFGDNKVKYSSFNFELNGKFYLVTGSSLRPFLGLGAGYNRTSLAYESPYYYGFNYNNNQQEGNETKVSASNMTGTAMVGVEFDFSENVGLGLDFRYTSALTNGFSSSNQANVYGTNNPYNNSYYNEAIKTDLKALGRQIEEADSTSVNLGLVVRF